MINIYTVSAAIVLSIYIGLIIKYKLNTRSRGAKEGWKTRRAAKPAVKMAKPIWVSDLGKI